MNKVSRRDVLKMFGIGVGVAAVPAIAISKAKSEPKSLSSLTVKTPSSQDVLTDYLKLEDENGQTLEYKFRRGEGDIHVSLCYIPMRVEVSMRFQSVKKIESEDFDLWTPPFILTFMRGDECIISSKFTCESRSQSQGIVEITGVANGETKLIPKSQINQILADYRQRMWEVKSVNKA